MIKDISNWAGSIVVSVIIVTILEMILPEGKNKKYIKTVMAIYILFSIVSPVIKAIGGGELNIDAFADIENNMIESNSISIQTSTSIENVYINNIKKDVEAKLEQKGYKVINIDLDIEKDNGENYGRIQKIEVTLKKLANEEKKNNKKVEPIEISIGDTGLKKDISVKENINQEEKENIKSYLSSIYEIELDKINIKEG